jgi:uncharacterized peroxidase-related enzyme
LRAPGTLSPGERELIATFVSSRNDCHYCQTSHGAVAAVHLGGNEALVADVKRDFETAAISSKLKALLAIAGKVQEGGKRVHEDDIARARAQGATDLEIHDTVLIAAAFCMFNRYVDGLATWAPAEPESYRARIDDRREGLRRYPHRRVVSASRVGFARERLEHRTG